MNISSSDDNYEPRNIVNPQLKKQLEGITFDIIITQNEWIMIKPIEMLCVRGELEMKLQEGWADIIIQKIWDKKRLPCCFNFQRQYIYKNYKKTLDSYVKIEGGYRRV